MLDKFLKQHFHRTIFHSLHTADDKTFIETDTGNQSFVLKSMIKNAQFYVYVYCDDYKTLFQKDVFDALLHKNDAEVKIILNPITETNPDISEKLSKLNGKVRFTDKMHDRHFCVSDYKRWMLKKNHSFFYNLGSPKMAAAMKAAFQRLWEISEDIFISHLICSHPIDNKDAQQTVANSNSREI